MQHRAGPPREDAKPGFLPTAQPRGRGWCFPAPPERCSAFPGPSGASLGTKKLLPGQQD